MDISPEKHKLLKYPTLAALAVTLATPLVACEHEPERTAGAPMPPPELKTDKPSTPSDAGKNTPKHKSTAEEEEEQTLGGDVVLDLPN